MKLPHFIIIADRNPNICRYLSRELRGDGDRIFTVKSFTQLRLWIEHQHPMDLLVLDPSLLEEEALENLSTLMAHIRAVPLIIHCLPGDRPTVFRQHAHAVMIEKSGHSITRLKEGIEQLLKTAACPDLDHHSRPASPPKEVAS